ncbi:hypothetical protein VW35_03300 [Devosia soli]|uniref:DUF4352 domain-containing protein n=1 Tax=Devosia soli TaxID=361041 RepID=A0A0F5LFL9_9HYPH|nr:hypothetical protein VW35_03300 [Devosia soli]
MTIAGVIVAALTLSFLQTTTPPYAMITGPLKTSGQQGEAVTSTTFSVQVGDVARARTIGYNRFGEAVALESSGVWVVVSAELRGFKETMPVHGATIVGASGRRYRQSDRASGAPDVLSTKVLQPGLPTTGIFIFEMPEDETGTMTLVVSEQYEPQLQDEISLTLEPQDEAVRERLDIGPDGI